jgi:predicted nucleotidyltransferase
MGKIASPSTGLSNVLFSKVQQRVLGLIFARPDRSFYTSEVIKTVDSGRGAVERELSRLQSSGLVSVERIGNQKHYRANRDSPIFEELHGLVLKTVALKESLKTALEPWANTIKSAFIYGSVAKGTDTAQSDIDLMVIGDRLDYSGLYTALQIAEDRVRRKINPMFLSTAEWRRRSSEDGSFARKLRSQPRLFVIGSGRSLPA